MAMLINSTCLVNRALVLGYLKWARHRHGNGRADSHWKGNMRGHLSTRSSALHKAGHLPLEAQVEAASQSFDQGAQGPGKT